MIRALISKPDPTHLTIATEHGDQVTIPIVNVGTLLKAIHEVTVDDSSSPLTAMFVLADDPSKPGGKNIYPKARVEPTD